MPILPMATEPSALPAPGPRATAQPSATREERLRQASLELEASFLAEMLKSAGFGEPRESFGGGAGEEGFASLLRQEQAMAMAQAGGFGLAEHIFESLKARTHD